MRSLLTDTGPLVAMLDEDDASHLRCVDFMAREHRHLLTTWPVVAEAMYLLEFLPPAQLALLAMIESARLQIAEILPEVSRIATLMEKYRDVPMDFADATLVAVAEREDLDTIFTLDGDFHIYRIGGRRAFQVVP